MLISLKSTSVLALPLYGLLSLSDSDSDSDSDSKPYVHIVLCRTCFHWLELRFRSLSQGEISIPITYISIRGSESRSEPMDKSCIVQESVSESESSNGNKPLKVCKMQSVCVSFVVILPEKIYLIKSTIQRCLFMLFIEFSDLQTYIYQILFVEKLSEAIFWRMLNFYITNLRERTF